MRPYHIINTCLIAFLLLSGSLFAQQKVEWRQLAGTRFSKEWNDLVNANVWVPEFSDEVLALEGQQIVMTGYVISVDMSADYLVLSANPFASCFFCGNAGPETVVELKLVGNHKRFRTDEIATFRGKLMLNRNDITALTYILEDAEMVD